ncbi:MAG: Rrf2 family transcriptional regulator [Calditerrivibrio sp.]|nr:Rrf2 family transcriptional regulator [Calditerrivibrio sp.]
MKITRASDYAIRVVTFFANAPKDRYYMRGDLSSECCIPDSFLGKLLQLLVKADILQSERGKKGGFKLKKAPDEISLYDIIVAIEGEIEINDCLVDDNVCNVTSSCKFHNILDQIRKNFITDLKKYKISDISF